MSLEITGVDTVKSSEAESIKAAMERNDCVVRAISASFDVSYDDAHEFVKNIFERSDKKGVRGTVMKMRELSEAFNKKITEVGEYDEVLKEKRLVQRYRMHGKWKEGGFTTISFIKKYPKGVYFILVRRHAFAIIDGVVHGNKDDVTSRRKRIKQAFLIEDK